ncbi:MAG TPA: sulfate transporter CysZ, partial [Gammaproteobacteria bacterium]|nr:sulfate transporter CysZ [Gammaproteobacteria bacterium]
MQARTAIAGAQCLLAGFGLLRKSGLKRYVFIPLCINLLLFAGLFWWAASGFETVLDWLLPQLPNWLAWLAWILWFIFALLLMLVMFFTFTLVANLIAAPFNGLLSARAELMLTGTLPVEAPSRNGGLIGSMAGAIRDELRKLGYFLGWALLVALISLVLLFIPLLNMLIAPLWFGFG